MCRGENPAAQRAGAHGADLQAAAAGGCTCQPPERCGDCWGHHPCSPSTLLCPAPPQSVLLCPAPWESLFWGTPAACPVRGSPRPAFLGCLSLNCSPGLVAEGCAQTSVPQLSPQVLGTSPTWPPTGGHRLFQSWVWHWPRGGLENPLPPSLGTHYSRRVSVSTASPVAQQVSASQS